MVGDVAQRTLPVHALVGVSGITIPVATTSDTGASLVNAERTIRHTARIVGGVAQHAGVIYTLAINAIRITLTREATGTVRRADRCIASAASIVRRVACLTDFINALTSSQSLAIRVDQARDTPWRVAVSSADRLFAFTSDVHARNTRYARSIKALALTGCIALPCVETPYALYAIGTEGRVPTAPCVIGLVT